MQLLLALGDDGEYLSVPSPCPKQRRISVPDEYPTQVAVQVCFLAAVHRVGTLARHRHLTGIGFPDSSSLRAYPSKSHVDSLR